MTTELLGYIGIALWVMAMLAQWRRRQRGPEARAAWRRPRGPRP